MALFRSYRDSILIKDYIKSKHIIVGDYSYYSGYYHGKSFEDCVMYLDKKDNDKKPHEIDRLIMGKFCSIASGVKFMMGGNQGHDYNWIATYPLDLFDSNYKKSKNNSPKAYKLKGDTVIGNDVWIGAEAMIMPGIRISDGAVIGARTLVTKHVGPYEIWGGNPAYLIKKRFTPSEIEKLLEIKWWNWEVKKLKQHLDLIRSSNVEALWSKHQQGS